VLEPIVASRVGLPQLSAKLTAVGEHVAFRIAQVCVSRCAAFAPQRCGPIGCAAVAQWQTEYTVDTHCKRSSVGVERTCRRAAAERSGAERIAVVAAVLQAQSPFSLRPPRYIAEEEEWEALPHSHHKLSLSGPPFIPT